LSQNCALVWNQWPRRSAVSPVMARLPVGVIFNSFSSSARISPGWIAGRGIGSFPAVDDN
jgi:hypothetical protein